MEKQNHGSIPSVQQAENSAVMVSSQNTQMPATPVNLQLSLGGYYSRNLAAARAEPARRMIANMRAVREMAKAKQHMELRLGESSERGKAKEVMFKTSIAPPPDHELVCAAHSASAHPKLLQALQIIKSEAPERNVRAAATHVNLSAAAASSTNISQPVFIAIQPQPTVTVPDHVQIPTSALSSTASVIHQHAVNPLPFTQAVELIQSGGPRFIDNNGIVVLPGDDMELLKQMPTLVTTGGVPNGRITKGLLYQYGIGVETIIICLCHGLFFSPTAFFMHGGGHDLENALKLIYLSPDAD